MAVAPTLLLAALLACICLPSLAVVPLGTDERVDDLYGIIYSIHDSEEELWQKRAYAASNLGLAIPADQPAARLATLRADTPTPAPECKKYEEKKPCVYIKHKDGEVRCFRGVHGDGSKDYRGRDCVCACVTEIGLCNSVLKDDHTFPCLNFQDCDAWDKVSEESCNKINDTFSDCVAPCGSPSTTTPGTTTPQPNSDPSPVPTPNPETTSLSPPSTTVAPPLATTTIYPTTPRAPAQPTTAPTSYSTNS